MKVKVSTKTLLAFVVLGVALVITEVLGLSPIALLEAALPAMTPLALAAMGESINQKAGLVNIGLEGIFFITAVAGEYEAVEANNGIVGLLFGVIVGALIGLFFGVLSVYVEQIKLL